jgi:hypothetical protein
MHLCRSRTVMCPSHRNFSVGKVKSSKLFPFPFDVSKAWSSRVQIALLTSEIRQTFIVKAFGGHVQSQTSNLRPNKSQNLLPILREKRRNIYSLLPNSHQPLRRQLVIPQYFSNHKISQITSLSTNPSDQPIQDADINTTLLED